MDDDLYINLEKLITALTKIRDNFIGLPTEIVAALDKKVGMDSLLYQMLAVVVE